jgi:hypothetical protein
MDWIIPRHSGAAVQVAIALPQVIIMVRWCIIYTIVTGCTISLKRMMQA